jgi:hypothetical protein
LFISRQLKTTLRIPHAQAIPWVSILIRTSTYETTIKSVRLNQPLATVTASSQPVQTITICSGVVPNFNIKMQEALPFAPGQWVERMGRYGWRGRITAIEGQRAYVNWGGSRQWLDLLELYPLDEQGQPVLPGRPSNLLEVARRARLNLKGDFPERQTFAQIPSLVTSNQWFQPDLTGLSE